MARNKGTFNLSANFEPIIQSPLDARMLVGSFSDLVLPATWEDDDNNVWLFDGAIVVVSSDPSSGIYWLKDSANYNVYSSWERLESGSISVVNVGDGSANVFAGVDSSGNIQLRSFSGSGGATVEVVGEQIIIGIDASYSGESNYGVNVGTGDASIYVRKVGDALEFREIVSDSSAIIIDVSGNLIVIDTSISSGVINYGENVGLGDASIYVQNVSDNLQFRELKSATSQILIDVSGNLVMIDASIDIPPAGESIDGGVWITDITPTSGGNVGDKVYSSDGNVLDSCLTDVSALTVHVLALPGHTNYRPIVTINDVSVSLSEGANQPLWTGTYPMTYTFSDASITVVHEDGAQWSTTVDGDTPANILTAIFTGGYPGSQTELKAGDTYDINITTDVSIDEVIIDNFGAFSGGTYPVTEGTNVTITNIPIADRGTSLQALPFRISVVKSTGSESTKWTSDSVGTTDGVYRVNLNNLRPFISFGNITYPASQGAIKTTESASVINTVSNYTTVVYNSPNGELTITSPGTYQTPKTVTYLSGTYNISTPNLDVSANRVENDATTTLNTVVKIANTAATLSVSNPNTRLRSGGNDGTSIQNHTITIQSDQQLYSAPTLQVDGGTTADWQTSPTFSGGPTTWTNVLQVHDDDAKGTYNWGAISGYNLAGIQTTTKSGATQQYVLGGFVQRTMTVLAQLLGKTTVINVEVSDYTKLATNPASNDTLAWSVKDMTTRSTLGDTTDYQANKWSASAEDTNPTNIYILDTAALVSSSQASSFTIQERV